LAVLWLIGGHAFSATAAPKPKETAQGGSDPIYVDANAVAGAGTGLTWTDAFTNLQDALKDATAGDEIWVAKGVYTPTDGTGCAATFSLVQGVALYGGFGATETVRSERDWEANVTILSGDLRGDDITAGDGIVTDTDNISGTNACHVTSAAGVTETARLDGFVITAGQARGGQANGGGMHSWNASPTVENVTFIGNSAGNGGGIYNNGSNPALVNVTFNGNSAALGGGMYNWLSDPVLTSVTFGRNAATNNGGGAFNYLSYPVLTNTIFSGNTATNNGGGIFNNGSSPALTHVTFTGNSAALAGGMYNGSGSNAEITNCILWGNGPDEIQNDAGSIPEIDHSDIQGSGGSGSWDSNLGTDNGGNIDENPLFVDADGPDGVAGTADDDLHLKNHSSPCVDAGAEVAAFQDFEGEQRPAAFGWDMGADELVISPDCYDFKGAEGVGVEDIQFLASHWRDASHPPYDADNDGTITIVDLMVVAAQWGQSCD
jgi:predicted outer membrane repeat protein